MKIVPLHGTVTYDGRQLATAFFDLHAPGADDALVTFAGPADVPIENMVDTEDVAAGAAIYSPRMAHVLVEHRGLSLPEAVWRQRLLVRLAADWIEDRCGVAVTVRGDDLFVRGGKLSVSVATASPRGALVHAGFNVEIEGTPVAAAGLRDLRVRPGEFLRGLAAAYRDECVSVTRAAAKVRPVA